MCGRYNIAATAQELIDAFGVINDVQPDLLSLPNYNITPTQSVPVLAAQPEGLSLRSMHWGLIPYWAKDRKIAYKTINARSETAHMKPAYRVPFRKSRCLIPATGWYEWQKQDAGKQPYNIHAPGGAVLAFAGLWACWQSEEGSLIESCTILTRPADKNISQIHARMPVPVPDQYRAAWLDPDLIDAAKIHHLLEYFQERVVAYPVSTYVNKPANNDAQCLQRRAL